jgi:cytochrome c551/c552
MMTNFQIIGLCSALLLFSCSNNTNDSGAVIDTFQKTEKLNITSISDEVAFDRLKNNCYACHNPNSESHDEILAPPLAGIKHKYKKKYPEEEVFIEHMSKFINSPTKEKALMKGPVKRFGVMPKTALHKTEIQELVQYIYNNDLETPEWFQEHFEEKHGK